MEKLAIFLEQKRNLANQYAQFFGITDFQFVHEPSYAKSNYWLNAVICPDVESRNTLLEKTNEKGVMTVCQENNEVVRNYFKDESRTLVIG